MNPDATVGSAKNLQYLEKLFATATHDASAAMSRWTDGLITLSLDEVKEIPLEDVSTELGLQDELLTMVVLSLEGDPSGEMILTFDDVNGRQLVSTLLGRPYEPEGDWTELERSALTETGNILGCAYMNALTRLVDRRLIPSPPYFIQDYGISVLQQALMPQVMHSDSVTICRTVFRREGEALSWHVLFVPSQELRGVMEKAIRAKRQEDS